MEKIIACFVKNCRISSYQYVYIRKKCFPYNYSVFISIRRMNCYMICLLNYSCHFIREENYISNITSFPALSVFMLTYVRILLLFV